MSRVTGIPVVEPETVEREGNCSPSDTLPPPGHPGMILSHFTIKSMNELCSAVSRSKNFRKFDHTLMQNLRLDESFYS